jgi:HAD superfamily hydrolase (TIGR01549 family)
VPERWRGGAILLDLFGTVVHFVPHVPTVEVAGTRWRSTMGWLQDAAARELPGVAFDDLLGALMRVTEDIVRARHPEYREVTSCERFRRALEVLGVEAAERTAAAERLSAVHMQHLASMTVLPAGHTELLADLARRYRLGIVSNFDHAPTAQRILAMHAVAQFFDVVLISDACGRRKPHPEIFTTSLDAIGTTADDALFVGDNLHEDVAGARAAGLATVWINAKNETVPPDIAHPDHTITQLIELAAIVR